MSAWDSSSGHCRLEDGKSKHLRYNLSGTRLSSIPSGAFQVSREEMTWKDIVAQALKDLRASTSVPNQSKA